MVKRLPSWPFTKYIHETSLAFEPITDKIFSGHCLYRSKKSWAAASSAYFVSKKAWSCRVDGWIVRTSVPSDGKPKPFRANSSSVFVFVTDVSSTSPHLRSAGLPLLRRNFCTDGFFPVFPGHKPSPCHSCVCAAHSR